MSTTGYYRKNQLGIINKAQLINIEANLQEVETMATAIDGAAVDGLSGVSNSLAYKVHEIEKHFHNTEQLWGNLSGFVSRDAVGVWTVTGGNAAWGPELHIHGGDVIESGSATMKFDLNRLYVTAADEANKVSLVEFLYGTAATPVANIVVDVTADDFELAGHGFVNDDKVIITTMSAGPTGVNSYTVYYVINVGGSANHFELSLTEGGAKVTMGGSDGTCSIAKLNTQTSLCKTYVHMSSVTNDSIPMPLMCPRIACNQRLFVRAWSESGSHVDIKFLLGLHTYAG